MITRAEFLKFVLTFPFLTSSSFFNFKKNFQKEALFYKKIGNKEIMCLLCSRECVVGDSERGFCKVRENIDGKYYTLTFGNPCAVHVDPIEKKPFFHFHPGSKAYSFATAGCNYNCRFCQNWEISQAKPEEVSSFNLSPKKAVEEAKKSGSLSVCGTYTEPIVFL